MRMSLAMPAAVCAAAIALPAPPAVAAGQAAAPGAPGATAPWDGADKAGFGTAYGGGTASPVWFTLSSTGGLSDVYYPDLSTPSARGLQFVVADGRAAVRVADAARHATTTLDADGLGYRQTDTDRAGRWRLTTTYVTDPARATVAVDVDFASLDRRPRRLYAIVDPQLANNGDDDTARSAGDALVASDAAAASALVATPAFTATSSGYQGASDGWTDLRADGRMDWHYDSAPAPGNVVQTGQTAVTGLTGRRHVSLALGFGATATAAQAAASATARTRFERVAAAYAGTWRHYLGRLAKAPDSLRTDQQRRLYRVSAMVLAASEDKAHPGAFVASPTMPWAWRQERPSGPYHLVWSRDLYEIATGLLAAGDRAGAERALDYLFFTQQKPDGSFPQNSTVAGVPVWTGLQLDEVAYPIVLAAQLGRDDARTWSGVKKAADFLLGFTQDGQSAPWSPQERWENQSGYSPATIAAEIAGLVCAAGIARANGDPASATRYLTTADRWRSRVDDWTVTKTGPYSDKPYYLRLTKDGNPDAGTTYAIGDSGPSAVDQRAVVDPSFLELVRLGIVRPGDPAVVNTLGVVDRQLGYTAPGGRYYHRFSFDGYGETTTGADWNFTFPPDSRTTLGRGWPLLSGERGEYEIAAGRTGAARARLAAMANAAGASLMLPEQVWDGRPPAGERAGTPTRSALPLIWTHAQYLRLARDVSAGRVVEMPAPVAGRYLD